MLRLCNAKYVNATCFRNLLCPPCRKMHRHFNFVQRCPVEILAFCSITPSVRLPPQRSVRNSSQNLHRFLPLPCSLTRGSIIPCVQSSPLRFHYDALTGTSSRRSSSLYLIDQRPLRRFERPLLHTISIHLCDSSFRAFPGALATAVVLRIGLPDSAKPYGYMRLLSAHPSLESVP